MTLLRAILNVPDWYRFYRYPPAWKRRDALLKAWESSKQFSKSR